MNEIYRATRRKGSERGQLAFSYYHYLLACVSCISPRATKQKKNKRAGKKGKNSDWQKNACATPLGLLATLICVLETHTHPMHTPCYIWGILGVLCHIFVLSFVAIFRCSLFCCYFCHFVCFGGCATLRLIT